MDLLRRFVQFQPTLPNHFPAPDRNFNPRSPHGERLDEKNNAAPATHFNPRSPHGERQAFSGHAHMGNGISTHAPRTGSDNQLVTCCGRCGIISTHAPRTGSDLVVVMVMVVSSSFQPTLPHGERLYRAKQASPAQNFNPRSRTGSDLKSVCYGRIYYISTHAPARGATMARTTSTRTPSFQPTLPHGERHIRRVSDTHDAYFNPRSRTGSDLTYQPETRWQIDFNPRSRTGSDSYPPLVTVIRLIFQPTLPHGERRIYTHDDGTVVVISTHAPARGAT